MPQHDTGMPEIAYSSCAHHVLPAPNGGRCLPMRHSTGMDMATGLRNSLTELFSCFSWPCSCEQEDGRLWQREAMRCHMYMGFPGCILLTSKPSLSQRGIGGGGGGGERKVQNRSKYLLLWEVDVSKDYLRQHACSKCMLED